MATSLPWSVKGVDPRTRDAAKAAARRAGMTLGEWLDHKIRVEAEEAGDDDMPETTAPEQLDIAALSERLARLSQGQMDTSPQAAAQRSAPPVLSREDIDAALTQAAAAERLTRESSAKTAGALDSIARWIEKTESRLGSGERSAAERQERATGVIAEAIKTMGDRIVEMERKAAEAQRTELQRAPARPAARLAFSRDGLADAVSDIRTRQRALDSDEPVIARARPAALPESRIAALRQDLRELSDRIVPASPPPSSARPRPVMQAVEREPQPNPIEGMLADLGARLDRLDRRDRLDPVMKPLARIESEVSRLSQDRAGESYQRVELELGHLAAKVDALAARGSDPLEPVMKPLARIESEVSRLSQERSGESYQRVELEIAHLAAKVDALAARGGDRTILAPVLRDIAELRDIVSAQGGGDPRLDELSRQIMDLSTDMTRLRDAQPDGRELRSLSMTIEDVRDAIMADRGRDRQSDPALASLARQVENLAGKIETLPAMRPELINAQAEQLAAKLGELDSMGRGASDALSQRIEALVIKLESLAERQPSQIESRIDTLQQRIEALAEHGPTGVTRQIEALAGRIESLVAASNLTQMVDAEKAVQVARVDLRPIEDMLRGLAEKIEEAGKPGAETDAFDSLEQQISGLAQRLDTAAATRSAETGIERTLQDLVSHLQTMRQDTAAAAERAARAAISDMSSKAAAPSTGLTELSNLVTGLRETHVSSGRETQDAIGAVHQTLETIISRLSSIEADLVSERKPVAAAQPARQPEKPRAAPIPAARLPEALGKVSIALEDRIAHERVPASQPEEPMLAALDLPLEPGSGRPQVGSTLAPGQDPQSVRQNLIAAARRSAKAATEAAATPAATPEPEKSGGKLREIMEKRRRPILLGLAAIVLAMGTAHVVTGALRGDKATSAGNKAVQVPEATIAPEAPATAPIEPTLPTKDQSSTLEAAPAIPAPAAAPAAPSIAGPSLSANVAPDVTGSTMQPLALPPTMAQETLQPVTGLGELPNGIGSAGLRKAALGGDAKAVYELASRAADGPAATRDSKLALRLFERAAVAGLAPAQFRVGNMFEKGVGTQRDVNLARVWYTRAAEHGNAKAMHNLAVLHAEGVSGKPDYATATEWFKRAAELGVRDSQYNLAILLGRGLGAPVDLSQSYVWFAVAANQGDADAGRKREEVAQKLSAADLAAAKLVAEGWKPKPLAPAANDVAPPAKGWDETPSAADRKPAKQVRG